MNVTYLHFAPPSVRNTWPVGPSPVAKKVRPCGTARSICARTQHRLCLCFLTAFNANCRMPEGEAAKHSPILLPPSQTWTWNPSQNMFAACSCTIRTTRARHSLEGPVDAPTSAHNLIIIIFRIRVACLQHVQKAACPYATWPFVQDGARPVRNSECRVSHIIDIINPMHHDELL